MAIAVALCSIDSVELRPHGPLSRNFGTPTAFIKSESSIEVKKCDGGLDMVTGVIKMCKDGVTRVLSNVICDAKVQDAEG
jgi:hypothetical protein